MVNDAQSTHASERSNSEQPSFSDASANGGSSPAENASAQGSRTKRAKRKALYNAIMVVAIILIAAGAVLGVGTLQGWFSFGPQLEEASYPETEIVAQNKVGNVNIERGGIAYALENGDKLRNGDIIQTLSGSSVEICYGEVTEAIPERSEVVIHIDEKHKVSLEYGNAAPADEGEEGPGAESSNGEEVQVTDDDGTKTIVAPGVSTESAEGNAGASQGSASASGSASAPASEPSGEAATASGDTPSTPNAAPASSGGNATTPSTNEPADSAPVYAHTCTIQISCVTILDNLGNLRAGKDKYVPPSGLILATSTVPFNEGDTVFDVLRRTCDQAGIQLEYSWTPLYESYYIEGINNLYEFDCGNESGWMYEVNGWYPNYGCSSYPVKDGDAIVWNYTCNGYGADLGAPMN